VNLFEWGISVSVMPRVVESGCTCHYLHILATYQHHFIAIGKLAVGLQGRKAIHCGSIEITRSAHSKSACSPHVHVGVVLHAHLGHGESLIQHNTNREVTILAARLG